MSFQLESSLTTPSDKKVDGKMVPNRGLPLSYEQTDIAMKEMVTTSYIDEFPKAERRYADPRVDLQTVALFSFVPAVGSKPNENGIYGFAKIRGSYPSKKEALEATEDLIRKHDSYHKVFLAYVGRPFPVTLSSDFSESSDKINVKDDQKNSFSQAIKKKREEERKLADELDERKKQLEDEHLENKDENPQDYYNNLYVKRAQIKYQQTLAHKQVTHMKESIEKIGYEIKELDKDDEDKFKALYETFDKSYKDSKVDMKTMKESFMGELAKDINYNFNVQPKEIKE